MSIMSEEEKKAIEWFKKDLMFWLIEGKDYVIIDNGEIPKMKSLLNLIEKQQKEIEEKNCLIDVLQHKIEELLDNKKEINYIKPIDIPVRNYINEDKIREKIKELKNIIEFEKPTYEDCLKYTIDILEGLLEEK